MRSITLFVAQPSGETSAARVPFADNRRSLLWLPSPGALVAAFDGNIAPIRLLQGRDLVVTISPGLEEYMAYGRARNTHSLI